MSAPHAILPLPPELGELSERILPGEVREGPGLSKRNPSLTTAAALTAMHRSATPRGT